MYSSSTSQKNSLPRSPQNHKIHETSSLLLISDCEANGEDDDEPLSAIVTENQWTEQYKSRQEKRKHTKLEKRVYSKQNAGAQIMLLIKIVWSETCGKLNLISK